MQTCVRGSGVSSALLRGALGSRVNYSYGSISFARHTSPRSNKVLSTPPQWRSFSLWPSSASPSKPPSSSPSTSSETTWTEDSWAPAAQTGSPTDPTNSFVPPSPVPEPSATSSAISEVISQTAQSAPVPPPVVSVPINPLTNLPIDGNHIGDINSLGLGGYSPIGLAQNLLEQIHVYTGLPWWGTIISVSVLTRVLLWPYMLKGMGRGARFFPIKDDVERIMQSVANGTTEEKMKATLESRALMKKHDASPFGTFPPMLAQAAIVFMFFMALERMSHLPLESLKTGGLAWFENLTVPDPTYYLPGIASLIFLAGLEATEVPQDENASRGKNIGRVLLVAGFFILKSMPAGVVLFIGTNGVLQVLQGLFLRVPGVRQRLRIPLIRAPPPPKPPTDLKGP